MNRQLRIALVGVAAGYLISEYLTIRRAYKHVKSATSKSTESYRYRWAAQMVLNEAHRGKYNHCGSREEIKSSMDVDFEYYQEVANILGIERKT
jgi:hypothetical protein